MKLEFISQTMTNFKAFRGRHEFLWDAPGLNFIRGENKLDKDLTANGASKSSVFDAWCWCLFGRTPSNLRNPDVLPWSGEKNTQVSVRLMIDAVPHMVQRSIGPNRLVWDDEDIDQDKLNTKLLGLNFDLATNTILLPQDRPLFFDRTPEKKMELFSETLDYERWDRRVDRARERRTIAEGDIAQYTVKREGLVATLDEVGRQLIVVGTDSENWADAQRKKKQQVAAEISKLEQELEVKENELGTANLNEDGAETELVALRNETQKLLADGEKAKADLIFSQRQIKEAEEGILDCLDRIKEMNQAKKCPTCGQPIKSGGLKTHAAEILLEHDKYKLIVLAGVPRELSVAVAHSTDRRNSHLAYISDFEAKRWAARADIARLTPAVERGRAGLGELRRARQEENPFIGQIKDLQERKRAAEANLAAVSEDLSQASLRAECYGVWIKGFKDIKLQLVEEILYEFEVVTNSMLDEVGLGGWRVRYDIEKETKSGNTKRAFNVEIQSPESKGYVKWESWSGGERQRLKLVGALALSDVLLAKAGIEPNVEVLDEPAAYWSADGIQDLCAYLSDRARSTGRSLFLVEHAAAESAHFSRMLTVIKDDDGARIEEG